MMHRYSIFSLFSPVRNTVSHHDEKWQAAWRSPEPKREYDVIGGGNEPPVRRYRRHLPRRMPAGLYYKTFMRARCMWMKYEHFIRACSAPDNAQTHLARTEVLIHQADEAPTFELIVRRGEAALAL